MVALVKTSNRFDTDLADRRLFPRHDLQARVEGRRLDHSLMARRQPRLSLRLQDLSVGGLSAITDLPLNCGERLSVYFPPTLRSSGWDAYGRVLRCEPAPGGYHVAVEFDPLPAA